MPPDHVHMMIAIPPKQVVSPVSGGINGKSAIHMVRVYGEKKHNFVGQHFWSEKVFRFDSRSWRIDGLKVHQELEARRCTTRQNELVTLNNHREVILKSGGRVNTPRIAALSDSQIEIKASGFSGGYLL